MSAGAAQHERSAHLGWLIWCYQEGYTKAEDRAILTNWLLDDPSTMHPDDAAERLHLLAMADEILAEMRERDYPRNTP